jgi:hypothetical protein
MRAHNLLAVTVLLSATACQLTPPVPAPISRGAAQAVQYTGAVSQESWVAAATPAPDPKDEPIEPTQPEPVADAKDIVRLETAIYVIDRKAASHLLSLPHAGLVAADVDHARIREALAALVKQRTATALTCEELDCIDKSKAMLSLLRQRSYVQGYDLLGIEDAMVADPKVGVVQDGVVLDIKPTRSQDRATLDLELNLTLTRLESPLPSVRVPGRLPTEPSLLMEVPVFSNERLQTKAKLPADKTLFFGGLASEGGGSQVVMVFLRQLKGDANPAAASRSGTPTAGPTPP